MVSELSLSDALRKKTPDQVGKIPKWQTPPPPIWEHPVWKKIYGLFCILGPKEHFGLHKKSQFLGKMKLWEKWSPSPYVMRIFLIFPQKKTSFSVQIYQIS